MPTIKKHIYADKLNDIRWQKVKNTIQIRDMFTCQKCGTKEGRALEVHHRNYLPGRDPWDYPEQLLVLLCRDCHQEEEDAADVINEIAPTLRYWGYYNTQIRDIINKLIQLKIPEKPDGNFS